MKITFSLAILLVFCSFLLTFGQSNIDEKIILHHDKPYYFSGETIRFSVHLLDNTLDQNPKYSELIYIKLFNKHKNVVAEGKILTSGMSGYGSLSIDKLISSGYYEIVAYTNRLLNYGESAIFRKRLAIYSKSDEDLAQKQKAKINISVEGGQLVDRIANRVAIHVTDAYSSGFATTVNFLIDSKVEQTIKCDQFGFGSFFFVPEQGKKYELKLDSTNFEEPKFPKVAPSGTALQIRDVNDLVQIILQTNTEKVRNLQIELRIRGEIKYSLDQPVNNTKPVLVPLSKKTLPNEIVDIVVSDDGKILNTRSFMVNANSDSSSSNIHLSTAANNVSPGGKININLTSSSSPSLVSLSIIDSAYTNFLFADPLAEVKFNADLFDICVLSSIPVSTLTNKSTFDHLMLFNKPQLTTVTNDRRYKTENYLHLKGTLQDTKPLPKETKLLFYVSGINMTYQTTADSTGNFSFPMLFEFYNNKKIVYIPVHNSHDFQNPQVIHNNEVNGILNLNIPLAKEGAIIDQIDEHKRLNKIYESYSYFQSDSLKKENPFDVEKLFKAYSLEVNMDDYVVFNTMEEVIKEILPGVQLRNKRNDQTLKIYSKELDKTYDETPLIFVDNSPILKISDLLSISPKDIQTIKVVSDPDEVEQIGAFAENGIIIIKLKENTNLESFSNTSFMASGLLNSEPSYRPNPDFSEVLLSKYFYLSPNETTNFEVKSSYRPSNYVLKVKAINSISSEVLIKNITVKN